MLPENSSLSGWSNLHFFLVEQADTLAFSSGSNLNVPQDTWLP